MKKKFSNGTVLLMMMMVALSSAHSTEKQPQNGNKVSASLSAADSPNIVVVFTDDQTYQAVGYNNPEILTPNLDRLAGQGHIFEQAFVSTPICAASRASVLTGLFPQQNKCIALNGNNFKHFRDGGPKADLTLPRQIEAAGYYTVSYGKTHLGDPKLYGFAQGEESGGSDYNDVDAFARVADFITSDQAKAQPFFLWIAPRQPHVPLLPTQAWLDLYTTDAITLPANFRNSPLPESIYNQGLPGQNFYRDSDYTNNWRNLPAGPARDPAVMRAFTHAYYATVSHLDDQVGTMVEQLKTAGLWDNTILIFLSDNGYHLGSHGLGNKITMHEESVRVPMFAVGPGIPKGSRSSSPVSSLDVYPTVLELASLESIPAHSMGQSLIPFFKNPSMKRHDPVFAECVGVDGSPGQGHRMARSEHYKYVLTGTDEAYFFDLRNDPTEVTNRINDPALRTERDELRRKLLSWMKEIGDRSPRIPGSDAPTVP